MNPARQSRTPLDQRYRPPSRRPPLLGHLDELDGGRRYHRNIGAGRPNADSRGTNLRIAASSCTSDNAPVVIVASRADSASAAA